MKDDKYLKFTTSKNGKTITAKNSRNRIVATITPQKYARIRDGKYEGAVMAFMASLDGKVKMEAAS